MSIAKLPSPAAGSSALVQPPQAGYGYLRRTSVLRSTRMVITPKKLLRSFSVMRPAA